MPGITALPSSLNAEFAGLDVVNEVPYAVMSVLEEGRPHINNLLSSYGLSAKTTSQLRHDDSSLGPIIFGHRKQIDRTPAITVGPAGKDVTWLAMRVKKEKFNLTIRCHVKIVKLDVVTELTDAFANVVMNWLNAWDNKRYRINDSTGATAYDSQAESYTLGFSENGAFRIAEIRYWCTVDIPYIIR